MTLLLQTQCKVKPESPLTISYLFSVNESAEAVLRHNIFTHKNIATITADDMVELVPDDTTVAKADDSLMTSAAQEMMVCLYRNQLLNVFVRVALVAIPVNSCPEETLPLSKWAFLFRTIVSNVRV